MDRRNLTDNAQYIGIYTMETYKSDAFSLVTCAWGGNIIIIHHALEI